SPEQAAEPAPHVDALNGDGDGDEEASSFFDYSQHDDVDEDTAAGLVTPQVYVTHLAMTRYATAATSAPFEGRRYVNGGVPTPMLAYPGVSAAAVVSTHASDDLFATAILWLNEIVPRVADALAKQRTGAAAN